MSGQTVALVIALVALGLSLLTLVLTLASHRPRVTVITRPADAPILDTHSNVNLYRVSSGVLRTEEELDEQQQRA